MKYHRIITLKNGQEAGTAGIKSIGNKYKVRHRAKFGISLIKKYWGPGIGRAISIYQKAGFIEYGRNPYGFYSRINGFQELILMRKEL